MKPTRSWALVLAFPLLSACAGAPAPGGTKAGLTFLVEVPENTPADDTVWVYVFQDGHKMERVEERLFRFVLDESGHETVRYRYVRNGFTFQTAEYLAPTPEEPGRDTNDYFWTKQGRETEFERGKVQRDVVGRWRWFPDGPLPSSATTLEPRGPFLPRVGGADFRSGQTIEDLYVDAYADFIDVTADRMKAQGFTWVELDPPWQWVEEGGLPRVKNDKANNPNYPDDETFLRELRAYTDLGIKAHVAPQLCCNALDTRNRSAEWWDAYFGEVERFLLHFASLAEQGGADAFSWAVADAFDQEARWRKVFESIRTRFSGEVGQMVWVLGPDVSPTPDTIPQAQAIKWGDALDFFLVHSDFPLSTKDDPSEKELEDGARAVVNGTKALYDRYGKPILLRNGYMEVKHTWKGQTFYSIGSVPNIHDAEAKLAESPYRFDTHDHARTVNAQFQAIAESPWVVGYLHFGYTHWEDPLSPWMSIRGKEAEDVWRKWNDEIN